MADTTIGQASAYYKMMSKYFADTASYYQNPSTPAPLFMELLPSIQFSQVLTESQNKARTQPSMVSGALIETCSSMFATLREAGMRSKTRSDFWAESEAETSQDAKYYNETGQLMVSYINGTNDAQN